MCLISFGHGYDKKSTGEQESALAVVGRGWYRLRYPENEIVTAFFSASGARILFLQANQKKEKSGMFHRPRTEEPETEKSSIERIRKPESVQAAPVAPVAQYAAAEQTKITPPAKEEKIMNYEQASQQDKEESNLAAPAAPSFQRPPQMNRAAPGFAPGYSATNPYGAQQNSAERRLVIGQGITMSGEIEACDYLLVEGTLEAALKGAKVLEIAETGTFYGAVEIEEATVAGRFEGELTVNGRLTIKSGGSVVGGVSYKELAVEAGALLDGKISPLTAKAAVAAPAPKKAPAAKNDNAGDGSELPFSGTAAVAAE